MIILEIMSSGEIVQLNDHGAGRRVAAALLSMMALSGCGGHPLACTPGKIFAQNRFLPPGAELRSQPSLDRQKIIGSFAPNTEIHIDGWKHTGVIYPEFTKQHKDNTKFENDIMLRLAGHSGWVAFQAVRSEITEQAPNNLAPEIGPLIKLRDGCKIK